MREEGLRQEMKFLKLKLRQIKWHLDRYRGERLLNKHGQGAINFIDVGALGWIPEPWSKKENSPKIKHLLRFEPQENASKNEDITTIGAALWKENAERDFYFFADEAGGASLFQQNYDYVQENYETLRLRGSQQMAKTWLERSTLKKVAKIKCRALDDVISELDQPFSYHFIKIDAQGAEYEILQGAENFLKSTCLGLHLELFEVPMMKGIKLLPEVVQYLDGLGFELVIKMPTKSTFDAAYDCVFLKKEKSELLKIIQDIYGLA